ncbi:hypothetical protein [Archangium primigenium]|uniref:hypothetical protein n=1 Tax=[Archangium] primigenium TaxID=2792470 RepID=UPI001958F720|nr:hypothetical protein [Archangium primigenium]
MLRLLLLLLLVNGLVPALGEALELAVHYAVAGHVAHGPGETDLAGSQEHGCGPTAHHCRCCVSQSVVPTVLPGLVLLEPRERPHTPFLPEAVTDATRGRLLRPPIRA